MLKMQVYVVWVQYHPQIKSSESNCMISYLGIILSLGVNLGSPTYISSWVLFLTNKVARLCSYSRLDKSDPFSSSVINI